MSCVGVLPEEQPVEANNCMDSAVLPLKGRLHYGQAVQVVSVVEQVARLARAGGYVIFEKPSHLVRVGEPLDEACRLQGMQLALWEERQNMEQQMRQLDRVDRNLSLELDQTMTKSSGYGKYASALASMTCTQYSSSTSSTPSNVTTEELLQQPMTPDPSKSTRPRSSSHSPTSFTKAAAPNENYTFQDESSPESFYICCMIFGCDVLAWRDYLCTTTYTSAAATNEDNKEGVPKKRGNTRYYSMQQSRKLPYPHHLQGNDLPSKAIYPMTTYWTEDDGSVSTALHSASDTFSHGSSSVLMD